MKIAFFDTHNFERKFYDQEKSVFGHEIVYFETRLTKQTADLALGAPCVCVFVNDCLEDAVLKKLSEGGTKLLALRSAGFNHVDLAAAKKYGIKVVRVPEYSPYAVAEHAVALILSLNRKIHRAYNRIKEANFSLEGLVGFDLHGKNVGVIGTGKIGAVFANIMRGFGCKVFAYDLHKDKDLVAAGVTYLELDEVFKIADMISLHIPLTNETRHIINARTLGLMKPGAMLINTGRGALIDTPALITALKAGKIGSAGLDVYEEEEGIFFQDFSEKGLQDDVLARLLTFPNVLLTSHQGFLTEEALHNIAHTTLTNIQEFESNIPLSNEVSWAEG